MTSYIVLSSSLSCFWVPRYWMKLLFVTPQSTNRPTQVTFKPSATDADITKAKNDIIAKGGSIGHEYTIIRGFRYGCPPIYLTIYNLVTNSPSLLILLFLFRAAVALILNTLQCHYTRWPGNHGARVQPAHRKPGEGFGRDYPVDCLLSFFLCYSDVLYGVIFSVGW